MPRTALTKITPKGPYPGTVAANDLDIAQTAADVGNMNAFPMGGDDLLIVQNTHASNAYTFTLTSIADSHGRTGDVTTYSLAAGEIAAFRLKQDGWKQTDGNMYLAAENAAIKFSVLALQ
jgi:hypothetical protein